MAEEKKTETKFEKDHHTHSHATATMDGIKIHAPTTGRERSFSVEFKCGGEDCVVAYDSTRPEDGKGRAAYMQKGNEIRDIDPYSAANAAVKDLRKILQEATDNSVFERTEMRQIQEKLDVIANDKFPRR